MQTVMGEHMSSPVASEQIMIPTKKDNELYDFIKLIVKKNLPLSSVEDNDFRTSFKHKSKFSKKLVRNILFNLVPMVEHAIEKEMKEVGYGAIMHDGWSKFGTHYVAIFGQYNKEIIQRIGKDSNTTKVPTTALLAVRPMMNVPVEDKDNDNEKIDSEEEEEEATEFTSEVHANFFGRFLENII